MTALVRFPMLDEMGPSNSARPRYKRSIVVSSNIVSGSGPDKLVSSSSNSSTDERLFTNEGIEPVRPLFDERSNILTRGKEKIVLGTVEESSFCAS